MTAYLVGNLLGRLFMSYVLVWLVVFLVFSKFDWRRAFTRTHRWYGVLAVAAVFFLGLIGAAGLRGGL